ncbi:hypothetical protein ABZW38_02990 [Streptomyces bacillaris]|uniref:hypothetical protein n=1 Tax=Streptomyces bacillaris TaxID=68179 RepID=UPI0034611318
MSHAAPPGLPPILRYFDFVHLPEPLQSVSMPFSELAYRLNTMLPPGPETTVALRKLLESKDAAVRAALDLPTPRKEGRHGDPADR